MARLSNGRTRTDLPAGHIDDHNEIARRLNRLRVLLPIMLLWLVALTALVLR